MLVANKDTSFPSLLAATRILLTFDNDHGFGIKSNLARDVESLVHTDCLVVRPNCPRGIGSVDNCTIRHLAEFEADIEEKYILQCFLMEHHLMKLN